ncbi:MAG: hypothetical protein ACLTKT_03355 [Clostridia bacterium]
MLTIILGLILSPIAIISTICSLGIIYYIIKGIAKALKEIYKKEDDKNG